MKERRLKGRVEGKEEEKGEKGGKEMKEEKKESWPEFRTKAINCAVIFLVGKEGREGG